MPSSVTTPAVTTETAPGTSEAGTTTAADVTEETSSAETTAPGGSAEPAEDLIVDSVRLPIGKPTQDVRLDDGTTNIDSLDAMEYALEREIPYLL